MSMLATDPPVSEAQRKAMYAAAEGRSTLGIPKKVGKEFIGKDMGLKDWRELLGGLLRFFLEESEEPEHEPKVAAAGILYVCRPDLNAPARVLLIKRSLDEANYAGYWSIPGGGVDEGEQPAEAALRESQEEIGHKPEPENLEELFVTELPLGDQYVTYRVFTDDEFEPKLNAEHTEWKWFPVDDLPKPVHPGVLKAVARWDAEAVPASDADWKEGDHPRRDDGKFGTGGGSGAEPTTSSEKIFSEVTPDKFQSMVDNTRLLEPHEEEALTEYMDVDYTPINNVLRLGVIDENDEQYLEQANVISKIINDSRATDNFKTYRGVSSGFSYMGKPGETDPSKLIGTVFKDKSFVSTSVNKDNTNFFKNATENDPAAMLTINVPKGSPALPLEGPELEVLLQRGTEFKVTAAERVGNTLHVSVDVVPKGSPTKDSVAMDRATVRSYDADGRLHVATSHISKATVNPYMGKEIPGFEELGLKPDAIYQLLRDPQELAKAAPTFNNLPLLSRHVPVTADSPEQGLVIGSTGTDAIFTDGYLDNSLVVWVKSAIDLIESETQKELSSAYRYRPDMTPGSFGGIRYDGVMRDIVGNHVALVEKGRAGSDVVVGDAIPKELQNMSHKLSRTGLLLHTALYTRFAPLLAQDKAAGWTKAVVEKALKDVKMKGLLAADGKTVDKAKLKPIIKVAMDALEGAMTPEAMTAGGAGPDDVILKLLDHALGEAVAQQPDMDADPIAAAPAAAPAAATGAAAAPSGEGGPNPELMGFLKDCGLDEASLAKVMQMLGAKQQAAATGAAGGGGGENVQPAKTEGGEGGEKEPKEPTGDDMPNNGITQKAMDAAIGAAVTKAQDDIRAQMKAAHEAREFVAPWVGQLPMALDSAEEVMRSALKILGVKVDNVHADALRPIIANLPKPGARTRTTAAVPAMDQATVSSFGERFKGAANIGIL